MNGIKGKHWFTVTVGLVLGLMLVISLPTIIVDPFFHYHAPLKYFSYRLERDKERYINDGIARNFKYDALITGTSMVENFKTSEMERLFGVNAVKMPFSGAYYKEVNDNLKRALESQSEIKIVIRSLDTNRLLKDKDLAYLSELPYYLYDNNILNDLNYLLNKESIILTAKSVLLESGNLNFDDYAEWDSESSFGVDVVLKSYERSQRSGQICELTQEQIKMLTDNLEQNVITLIDDYPDTMFYLFFPPYSIVYWDDLNQQGQIQKQISIEQIAIETLLKYENVKIFSFSDNFNLICNLDNYRDAGHYNADISSDILQWMCEDKYKVTKDNYKEYLNTIEKFYLAYDYDAIFDSAN